MHTSARLLPMLALVSGLGAATPPPESTLQARRAAAMLGPTLWKRVILIRNTAPASRYPRSLGAVVFEMGGILWFYTSTDGTQSLSLELGRAEADKRDLGRLLPAIDPGFTQWEFDAADGCGREPGPPPPNACFLECVALLRTRLSAGDPVEQPRLLSYYVALPGGLRGHTVLFFRAREALTIIDPLRPKRRFRIRPRQPEDAKDVAGCLRSDIASARWVPIAPGDFSPGLSMAGQRSFSAAAGLR
jgi:hypothetical protein